MQLQTAKLVPLTTVFAAMLFGAATVHAGPPSVARQSAAQARAPYDVGRVAAPRLFAEGVISTDADEINGAFSPDGAEYYFVRLAQYTTFPRFGLLCVSKYRDGRWSEPEVLSFSGRHLDFAPRLSPDGKTMYFTSLRPAPGTPARVLRVWSVQRKENGWGEPVPLPAPINTDDQWNAGASQTRDGALYFASTRAKDQHFHIFRSAPVNGGWSEPEMLGREVNSPFNEADPFISPDERILVFSSTGMGLPGGEDRKETVKGGGVPYARGDLYVSIRRNGQWTQARHLEHGINTFADEASPSITPDGRYLFFTSERSPFSVPTAKRLTHAELESMLHSTLNGHGNIFYISLEAIEGGFMPGSAKP